MSLKQTFERLSVSIIVKNKNARYARKKYCNKNIASLIKGYDIDAPVMVDLFCGAGGLSLGFTQEGFITSLANTTQFLNMVFLRETITTASANTADAVAFYYRSILNKVMSNLFSL